MAFNRESDIARKNANDAYFRYCVDEWKNSVEKGFDASNSALRSILEQFRSVHSRADDEFALDDYELAFVEKTNRAVLSALLELKKSGAFDSETFLIIWYSDSDSEIINKSAKALNSSKIYKQFASEFQ